MSQVRDPKAVAFHYAKRYYPFLFAEIREDVLQEFELFMLLGPPEELRAFTNAWGRHLYKVAKNYGWRRKRGESGMVRPFIAFVREFGEEDE